MADSIPNVVFNGQGSFPYAINFTSGGSEKSQLSLTFIDRSANYDLDNRFPRNTSSLVSVTVGAFFKFDGYIVTADVEEMAAGGAKLNVVLDDSSIILDKYVVGLKGMWGPGFTTTSVGTFGNLILIGTQVDPCKNVPPNAPDPCAPDCGEDNGGKESFNCQEEKLLKILEVDYSFPELQAAVAGIVKFGSFPAGINTEYRANYTGVLREVIKNWCQDFGIDFYWSENSIYFYDTKTGATINDGAVDPSYIISKKKSFSIEGNYTQGNVVYFGGEGEKREYSCSRNSGKNLTLRPITLLDILEDNSDTQGKPGYSFLVRNYDPQTYNLGPSVKCLMESIILNYYSDVLRDLYLLWENQRLDTVQRMKAFIDASSKRPIPALGGFKPTRICHAGQESITSENESYNIYTTLLSRMSPNEGIDFVNRGGYFVAADYNKTRHDYFNNFEKRLGSEFIGKYWIRGGVNGENYSFNAPDGNASYYSNGSEIQFPFLETLPADIRASSDFIEDVLGTDDPTKTDKTHGRFVIVERSAAWVPNQSADAIQKIIQEIEPFAIKEMGSEDVNGTNALKSGQSWFMVFPRPKGMDLNIGGAGKTGEDKNPFDAKNVGLSGVLDGINRTYGLVSSITQYYGIKTPSSSVKIYLPSQAGPKAGRAYPGYQIFANGSQFTNEIIKIINKGEFVLGAVPPTTPKDVGLQIQYRDVTQNLIDLFQANNNATCGYDQNKILTLLQNFNARYNTPLSVEREIREYTMSNMPQTKFTVKDGLQSFSLNYTSDGIETALAFSNLPPNKKSEALILEEFKKTNTILKRAQKYFVQP